MYCHVENRIFVPRKDILSYEDIIKFVEILSEYGIKVVRLTGGEPLIRPEIENLIASLRKNQLLSTISLTTNGVLLGNKIMKLREAGLDTINISIDSLNRNKYRQITGIDCYDNVWNSIKDTLNAGFKSVKINTILFKNINDNELYDFARLTLDNIVSVRFIEYFSTTSDWSSSGYAHIPNKIVKREIEKKYGDLIPVNGIIGNGPAVNYKIKNAPGTIGFINSHTEYFCSNCNRIRLTAQGDLYPCLFSPFHINIKKMIHHDADESLLKTTLSKFLEEKNNYTKKNTKDYKFIMSKIGG